MRERSNRPGLLHHGPAPSGGDRSHDEASRLCRLVPDPRAPRLPDRRANLTAAGIDDPDAYFYENYRGGASRNYTDYCSEELDRLMDRQSQELDRDKRLKLVADIQRKLESDVARPMLTWRKEYFTQWPYVHNLVPHNSLYNYARMQDVWLHR